MILVPKNGKIADITHADTNKHFLDLAAALSETRKIIELEISVSKMVGTGNFRFYPNEGARAVICSSGYNTLRCIIADGTQRLQYNLTVANDDFDLFCLGYVVEG